MAKDPQIPTLTEDPVFFTQLNKILSANNPGPTIASALLEIAKAMKANADATDKLAFAVTEWRTQFRKTHEETNSIEAVLNEELHRGFTMLSEAIAKHSVDTGIG